MVKMIMMMMDDGDDGDDDDGDHEDGGGAAVEGGDTGMSMAGICLMPPQATIAAVQHQPFPLQCSLPASLHDPPHVQVLTDRADPLRASQAAATCVAGTVAIVEDENSAAATCVAGRGSRCSSDVCRR